MNLHETTEKVLEEKMQSLTRFFMPTIMSIFILAVIIFFAFIEGNLAENITVLLLTAFGILFLTVCGIKLILNLISFFSNFFVKIFPPSKKRIRDYIKKRMAEEEQSKIDKEKYYQELTQERLNEYENTKNQKEASIEKININIIKLQLLLRQLD